jgi:hypothetical protein
VASSTRQEAYFSYLATLMKTNPPTARDAPIVARMAKIGLAPGRDFDPSKLGFLDREATRIVPKLALLEMGLRLRKRTAITSRWPSRPCQHLAQSEIPDATQTSRSWLPIRFLSLPQEGGLG